MEVGAKLQLKAFEELLRILDSYHISKRSTHSTHFGVNSFGFGLNDDDEGFDELGRGGGSAHLTNVTSAEETVDDVGALTWAAMSLCTDSHANSQWRIAIRNFFRNDYVANTMDGLIL